MMLAVLGNRAPYIFTDSYEKRMLFVKFTSSFLRGLRSKPADERIPGRCQAPLCLLRYVRSFCATTL